MPEKALGLNAVDFRDAPSTWKIDKIEEQVEQVLQKVGLRLGADGWISLPCADYTPWQHMNIHRHGKDFQKKRQESRKKLMRLWKCG